MELFLNDSNSNSNSNNCFNLIKKGTNSFLLSSDWETNLLLCDFINNNNNQNNNKQNT